MFTVAEGKDIKRKPTVRYLDRKFYEDVLEAYCLVALPRSHSFPNGPAKTGPLRFVD